jgi:transcriptional regulator with XRE-family HTH domain
MLSGTQVRAARAILGWSMRDLALQSFVSVAAIKLIESREDRTDEGRRQLEAIQAALEVAGIAFEGETATKRSRDDL